MKEIPGNITANKIERQLAIQWKDGHVSNYPFGLLRAACPCASCRGGHENMSSEPEEDVFSTTLDDSSSTRLNRIEAVGQYAITIEWQDGHHYGIYNWHYLRALCPCSECRNK
jgi:DUF971 family protein